MLPGDWQELAGSGGEWRELAGTGGNSGEGTGGNWRLPDCAPRSKTAPQSPNVTLNDWGAVLERGAHSPNSQLLLLLPLLLPLLILLLSPFLLLLLLTLLSKNK